MVTIQRTLRRTLDRLGVPYTEVRTGWRGSRRWGYRPIMKLAISEEHWETVVQPELDRTSARREARKQKDKQRREKQARQREEQARQRRRELKALADSLGVRVDSRTFDRYLEGDIDESECRRIGEITRRRHEESDYEELLDAGLSRDDARELMSYS